MQKLTKEKLDAHIEENDLYETLDKWWHKTKAFNKFSLG
jgi:hypothetical protein